MKIFKLLTLLCLIIATVMVGCSKETSGVTGPTGATGPVGPAGPTGPAGAAGANGPDSVLYSPWIPLAMTQVADSLFTQDIAAPAITQGVLDSCLILTYISYNDSATVYVINANDGLGVTFSAGHIYLASYADDSFIVAGWSFRYVIVPGSMMIGNSASGQTYSRQQLKTMSYAQVVKALGISAHTGTVNH